MTKSGLKNKNGQALIEAVVAISVLIIGMGGIFSLLASSLKNGRVVADNYMATYLAAEGIEIVKNIIDHNAILRVGDSNIAWNAGFSPGNFELDYASCESAAGVCDLGGYRATGKNLSFSPSAGLFGYGGAAPVNFQRTIKLTFVSQDEVQVSSVVTWPAGGSRSQINLEDHFFNWRP